MTLRFLHPGFTPPTIADSDLQSYVSRAGLHLTQDQADAFSDLVETLKTATASGTPWTLLDGIWLLSGAGGWGSNENLKSASYRASPSGNALHFPGTGWLGNNAKGARLDTGYPLDGSQQYKQDRCFLYVWTLTDGLGEAAPAYVVGAASSGGDTARAGLAPNDNGRLRVVLNNLSHPNLRVSKSNGGSWASRNATDTTGYIRIGRGPKSVKKVSATTALPPNTLQILNDSITAHGTNNTVALVAVGGDIDETVAVAIDGAFSQFLLDTGVIDDVETPEAAGELPNYMTKAMVSGLTFDVAMQGSGPADDSVTETNNDQFPMTCVLSASVNMKTTTYSGAKGVLVWADRVNSAEAPRPNGWRYNTGKLLTSGGNECRTLFYDEAKAMASLEAMVATHTGAADATVEAIVTGAGMAAPTEGSDVIASQAAIDAAFPTLLVAPGSGKLGGLPTFYACSTDTVIKPNWKLKDASGGGAKRIVLDYECNDGRDPDNTLALFGRLAAHCAAASGGAMKLCIVPGPLDNLPRQTGGGFTLDNLNQIHRDYVDVWYLAVTASATRSAKEQLESQIARLRGPAGDLAVTYSRLGVQFVMGQAPNTTTVQNAIDTFKFVTGAAGFRTDGTTTPMFGVLPWAGTADFGGDVSRLTVQKQWKLYFGDIPYGQSVGQPPTGAAVGLVVDFERNDLITESGGAISQIDDVVQGTAFTQATGANQPTLGTMSNGRQCAVFDGTDDYLRFTGQAPGLAYGTTGCIVGVVREYGGTRGVTNVSTSLAWGANSSNTHRRSTDNAQLTPAIKRLVTTAGTGAANSSNNGTVDQPDGPTWSLHYFNSDNQTIYSEDQNGNISTPTSIAFNTTTTSVNATIGGTAATTSGNLYLGKINYIEVIVWTTDANTIAQFKARLAQRIAT